MELGSAKNLQVETPAGPARLVPCRVRLGTPAQAGSFCPLTSSAAAQAGRMTELAFARSRTFVRLGEAVPDISIASAMDFMAGGAACRGSAGVVHLAGLRFVHVSA